MPQFSDDLFLGSALTVQGMDQYPSVSTFTGSIDVTGSLVVSNDITTNNLNAGIVTADEFSGSFSGSFEGDGSGLTNIQLANLSLEINQITSGSVTASVDPIEGFVVTSVAAGSTFVGNLFVSGNISITSGSVYSGSGANLFDIPESALSFSPNKIASGSVTASVSPNFGFRVVKLNNKKLGAIGMFNRLLALALTITLSASIVLMLTKAQLKDGQERVGIIVTAKPAKNRFAKPHPIKVGFNTIHRIHPKLINKTGSQQITER